VVGLAELKVASAPNWNLSCLDWADRIRNKQPLIPELPLWTDSAERAVGIFNELQLPDVDGKPKLGVAAGEWFRGIVRAVFGSLDPETKNRIISEFFCLAPKKSSKTSYSAGLMLTALLMNERPRAEFLLIAPSKIIAQLAFDQACGMIDADEDGMLQRRFHVINNIKEIVDRRTKAKLVIKAFDSAVLTGVKPVGVLIDELHEIAKDPAAERLLRQIRGGLLPNHESFLIFITTQSDKQPFGVFETELKTARAVRDGKSRHPMLPILYEFPPEIAKDQDLWENPSIWDMVNPNLGRPVSLESLIVDFNKAKDDGESALVIWASQHLNIEIGVGLSVGAWPGASFWFRDRNVDKSLTIAELIKRCDVIIVGIDGGGLDDLLGFAALGREKETRKWLLVAKAWAHKCVLERRKSIASQLTTFASEKSLAIIDDESDLDLRGVADIVVQINDAGLLPDQNGIGIDPSGISLLVDELERRGFSAGDEETVGQIAAVRQGYVTLNSSIKTAERRLAMGEIVHDGSKLMNWCVSNAKLEKHGNAVVITKQAAGTAKIDPLMAMFNAVALMALNPESARSVYEDEDFVV
jgi:phage terminase large subunit-like protein